MKKRAPLKPKPKAKPSLEKENKPEKKSDKPTLEKDTRSNAEIARDNQLAETPSRPIERLMKHEVKVGDTVCYFADVEDRWTVVELRGPWLRAQRSRPGEGMQNQCFLTDTMVPLELAQRLPRVRENGEVILASVKRRGRHAKKPAEAAVPDAEGKKASPRSIPPSSRPSSKPVSKPVLTPRKRGPRASKVVGTASESDKKKAAKYMESLREEHGKCESIRATVHQFPTFTREEIIEVAKAVGIKSSTANAQYSFAKQGG